MIAQEVVLLASQTFTRSLLDLKCLIIVHVWLHVDDAISLSDLKNKPRENWWSIVEPLAILT